MTHVAPIPAGFSTVTPHLVCEGAADMFWGDRYGQVTDPFSHTWSIATHQRDLTPEQMQQEMLQQAPDCGQ